MKKWFIRLTLLACLSVSVTANAAAAEKVPMISSFGPASLIKSDGTYWEWGFNLPVPNQVHGLTDVEKSFPFQIIMKKDQSVWYWERSSPAAAAQLHPIQDLNSILVDVLADGRHTLALDSKGKVWISNREFKNNVIVAPSFKPLSGIGNVASIVSYYDPLANGSWIFLKKDGTVWKGDNAVQSFKPIASLNNITAIDQNIALKKDGTVWTWPASLTANGAADSLTAVPVKGLAGISSIKKNEKTNFAIDRQGRLWLWGESWFSGKLYKYPNPIRIDSVKNAAAIWIVENSIVVLTSEGNVYTSNNEWREKPAAARFALIASDISEIKAADRHIILRNKNGTLWGWGVNKHFQLGHGDEAFRHNSIVPVQKPATISINGEPVILIKGVITRENQTYIPLRSVFEKLGAQTEWDERSKIVTITRKPADSAPLTITLDLNTASAKINGKAAAMQSKPFTIRSTAYVPLRFINEALGAKVDWVEKEFKIIITTQ